MIQTMSAVILGLLVLAGVQQYRLVSERLECSTATATLVERYEGRLDAYDAADKAALERQRERERKQRAEAEALQQELSHVDEMARQLRRQLYRERTEYHPDCRIAVERVRILGAIARRDADRLRELSAAGSEPAGDVPASAGAAGRRGDGSE